VKENGLEKGLANLWSRRKITKKAHAVRRQEIKREISINMKKDAVGKSRRKFLKDAGLAGLGISF
jgi:hypothetical protein